jgi:hypothetical protein
MNGDLRGESALFTPLAAFHVEIGRFPFTGGCESPLEIINWLRLLHLNHMRPHQGTHQQIPEATNPVSLP